jgi:hypothetical protein
MAELLVKAQEPWNNDLPNAPSERSRLGDIIVVRPDSHVWGNEECLPRFIVVKITNMTYDDAKNLEESLMVDDGLDERGIMKRKMAKVRKWQVPQAYMLNAIQKGDSVVEITLTNKQQAFIANLIEKTS